MSVAVSESSKNVDALDSFDRNAPSEHSGLRPVTLETLPDELLPVIFRNFDSFILPPLSKRLLPFHRSQRYRNVTLNLKQFEMFKSAINQNGALRPFVETLTLNFDHKRNIGSRSKRPRRQDVSNLMSSLRNLRKVAFTMERLVVGTYFPKVSDFDQNCQLETYNVRSWFYEEEEDEDDMFDWDNLRDYHRFLDEIERPTLSWQDKVGREVIVELERTVGAAFGLRYFAGESTDAQIHEGLNTTRLSQIQLVVFTNKVHLDRLLSNVGHPSLLTHLSVLSYDRYYTPISQQSNILLRFPNLTHLAVGGTFPSTSLDFYDSLRQLPLEYLQFGLRSSVHVQHLIDVLSDGTKPKLATLKGLILDNLEAKAPTEEEEDEAFPNDWIFPEWTVDCSKEKVQELKRLTIKLGIKTGGSTFRGLEVARGEAYEGALGRAEWREEMELYIERTQELERLNNLQLELRKYHEGLCGCEKDWSECEFFKDEIGV